MTFGAGELRDVAEVQRMLERLVAFVTLGTLPCVLVAKIHRMLKLPIRRYCYLAADRLV